MSERPVVGSIAFQPITYAVPPDPTIARDAARYRWLREQIKDLDKAIDEAMRGK